MQSRMIFDAVERKDQYLRLQVDLSRAPESAHAMDNASDENLTTLAELGREAAKQNDRELTAFAELLLGGATPAPPPVT